MFISGFILKLYMLILLITLSPVDDRWHLSLLSLVGLGVLIYLEFLALKFENACWKVSAVESLILLGE